MKTKTLYQVRIFRNEETSKQVGHKMRLLDRSKATAVVKRLRKSGLDAFKAPVKVTA